MQKIKESERANEVLALKSQISKSFTEIKNF